MEKELTIRPAKPDEVDTGFMLLKGAAEWLKDKKVDHWQQWLAPRSLYREWIKQGFEKKQFHFVEYEGQIIGMFRLLWSDELHWGEQEDNAGYIHSFTLEKAYRGQGLGRAVLKMIEDICREKGKTFLRLDCGTSNPRLSAYYVEFGFRALNEVAVHGDIVRLYEKVL